MSKHPENELWCQNHDQPISIDSLEEWEEAKAAGHLTFEHVINRLRAMLEYQFGRGGVAGFDENGFLVSLVADGWQLGGGISVHLYPNDHPPPHVHVHVRFRGGPCRWRLRLAIATGEPLDESIPPGWSKKARKARAFVVDSQTF